MKRILLITILSYCGKSAFSQCAITGLDPQYCLSDAAATMSAPGTGYFTGPGVSGTSFDPAVAGAGTHEIDYFEIDPNAYTIDQTGAYAPLPGGGTNVFLGDDEVSSGFPIGFTFKFFGTNYTTFYISSNGFITFSGGGDSGCCSGQFIPDPTDPNNLIALCWTDLYPEGGGSINYFTTGTAPNRKLVVNYSNIDACCTDLTPIVTSQLICYETTGIIEIHTEYTTSDVFGATQGIENFDGSIAFAVPGRNSADWGGLFNDYVAFLPVITCTSLQMTDVNADPIVTGVANPNPICLGDSVIFSGSGADTYVWDSGVTDGVFYTPAGSATFTVDGTDATTGCTGTATVDLVVNFVDFTLTPNDELFGSDGSIDLVITAGTGPFTFDWDNDGFGDADDNDTLSGVGPGTYTVIVTDANGCSSTNTAVVGTQLGFDQMTDFEFSVQPNPSKGAFMVIVAGVDLSNVHLEIVNSLGQQIVFEKVAASTTNFNFSGLQSGVYFVKLITEQGIVARPVVLE